MPPDVSGRSTSLAYDLWDSLWERLGGDMARNIGKLSAISVSRLRDKGLHSDGGGLYLRVTDGATDKGGKFWAFRFMRYGKAREMGLGALNAMSLADARLRAAECRKILAEGSDPITARDAVQSQERLASAREQTFRQCAESYIEAHKAGWRNAKHIWQWDNTLTNHVYPVFGDLPVQEVDLAMVLKVLEPIWKTKTETAARIRGRIEVILDWATAREYRKGENPARWKGHLENLLPSRAKVQRVTHRPALPYEKIGDFVTLLKEQGGIAAQAMAFTILTAARTSEVIGARWDEVDMQKGIWIIPANRIKAGREHRVALSVSALQILQARREAIEEEKKKAGKTEKPTERKIDWIFTGLKRGNPLSNVAMLALLKRMNRTDITVHGFRSTFRDWCAEQTNFPREVAEAALAHAVGDKVEAAYRRSDLFDKRRLMMDAWARYCTTPSAKDKGNNVTSMRRK